MSDQPSLRELTALGELDPGVAALLWLLAEYGLPLTVASPDRAAAERTRAAIVAAAGTGRAARLAPAGGVMLADSLEGVLRLLGGDVALNDATRDLGLVVIHDGRRVRRVHYVRPVERDGAGHLQRRPPAVLADWNEPADKIDDFSWAVTDELADRTGLTREELERHVDLRRDQLAGSARA
ncbi:MAG: hypothetical protein QOJ81_2086 [Chloroflexota bacterium]|jgi:hypothetical protein|nr:hypothetical protein [Chloroflexota bacterium]